MNLPARLPNRSVAWNAKPRVIVVATAKGRTANVEMVTHGNGVTANVAKVISEKEIASDVKANVVAKRESGAKVSAGTATANVVSGDANARNHASEVTRRNANARIGIATDVLQFACNSSYNGASCLSAAHRRGQDVPSSWLNSRRTGSPSYFGCRLFRPTK